MSAGAAVTGRKTVRGGSGPGAKRTTRPGVFRPEGMALTDGGRSPRNFKREKSAEGLSLNYARAGVIRSRPLATLELGLIRPSKGEARWPCSSDWMFRLR
jgi:hypothetical protein